MDVEKVIMEYDGMFGTQSLEKIDDFLTDKIAEALEEQDFGSAVTLMNEMMGFCRDTSQNEKGLHYCDLVIHMFEVLGMVGTLSYATSMLNVANAYRAFGLFDRSLELFETVEDIYRKELKAGEFHYASLYNNWGLLYQELGDFTGAKKMLERALRVVDMHQNAVIEQANTRTNLAATLLRIGDEVSYGEAIKCLEKAISIYEDDGGRDFHYSAALSAMGDALFMRQSYGVAAAYYAQAMDELQKHVGKTEAYVRVEANYNRAIKLAGQARKDNGTEEEMQEATSVCVPKNNLERCRLFYEQFGAPMIHEQFAEYETRIAVGFAGEGSDCYGFEDSISRDHDFGTGFCMWLSDEDYKKIGISLHHAYEKLVAAYAENAAESVGKRIDTRRGVCTIGAFYERVLGVRIDESDILGNGILLPTQTWLALGEDRFAEATNGAVFRDDAGYFSAIRGTLLQYYPEQVWQLRLAKALHDFAQYAQSNYARMMARKDYVAASLCIAKGAESAMDIAYLMNRTYAPYYKWKRRGMDNLCILRNIAVYADELVRLPMQTEAWEKISYDPYRINRKDEVICVFERMAEVISGELSLQGITDTAETFLDVQSEMLTCMAYGEEYAKSGTRKPRLREESEGRKNTRPETTENIQRTEAQSEAPEQKIQQLAEQIVKLEWVQFDKVKNEGGRADCQDDWNTFSIMRKSQYLAWSEKLLESYLSDLQDADEMGWNLIMEKYARMMESTVPERFAELKKDLPKRSEERTAIAEEIIKIQVGWMEEFAEQYPRMAGNARSIHTAEDTPYNTSYETYLRGELGTYSERTFVLYGRFIAEVSRRGENLAYTIMDNTAKLYGYKNVQAAEEKLDA